MNFPVEGAVGALGPVSIFAVEAAAEVADGVIVGSAIVDLIAKKKLKAIPRFVAALRKAIDAR